ncbi:MAG: hypothetical protein U5N86_05100 [Planctomycetota bacterium]|nr:hypothetical protein [Planctomycetota bacterium]
MGRLPVSAYDPTLPYTPPEFEPGFEAMPNVRSIDSVNVPDPAQEHSAEPYTNKTFGRRPDGTRMTKEVLLSDQIQSLEPAIEETFGGSQRVVREPGGVQMVMRQNLLDVDDPFSGVNPMLEVSGAGDGDIEKALLLLKRAIRYSKEHEISVLEVFLILLREDNTLSHKYRMSLIKELEKWRRWADEQAAAVDIIVDVVTLGAGGLASKVGGKVGKEIASELKRFGIGGLLNSLVSAYFDNFFERYAIRRVLEAIASGEYAEIPSTDYFLVAPPRERSDYGGLVWDLCVKYKEVFGEVLVDGDSKCTFEYGKQDKQERIGAIGSSGMGCIGPDEPELRDIAAKFPDKNARKAMVQSVSGCFYKATRIYPSSFQDDPDGNGLSAQQKYADAITKYLDEHTVTVSITIMYDAWSTTWENIEPVDNTVSIKNGAIELDEKFRMPPLQIGDMLQPGFSFNLHDTGEGPSRVGPKSPGQEYVMEHCEEPQGNAAANYRIYSEPRPEWKEQIANVQGASRINIARRRQSGN